MARRILGRGDQLWLGRVRVTVLHPSREDPGTPDQPGRATNHGSLVLRVDWGRVALLLTGDAEAAAEREVLASGMPVAASVLKVGHHGSRHASSAPFLAAVAPQIAVVSAGARNPFGHPSPAVLARLAELGFHLILYPLTGLFAAARAVESMYRRLRTDGTTLGFEDELMAFSEFNRLIGVDEKYALAERFHA